jgi:hypothetical protein
MSNSKQRQSGLTPIGNGAGGLPPTATSQAAPQAVSTEAQIAAIALETVAATGAMATLPPSSRRTPMTGMPSIRPQTVVPLPGTLGGAPLLENILPLTSSLGATAVPGTIVVQSPATLPVAPPRAPALPRPTPRPPSLPTRPDTVRTDVKTLSPTVTTPGQITGSPLMLDQTSSKAPTTVTVVRTPPSPSRVLLPPSPGRVPRSAVKTPPSPIRSSTLPPLAGGGVMSPLPLPAVSGPILPDDGVKDLPVPSGVSVRSSRIRTPAEVKAGSKPALSALPPATSRFESYADAVDANSINDLLMQKGYASLDTITMNVNGGESAFYIKAINSLGDIVFIESNRTGGLSVQLADRTLVKVTDGSSIAQSVKVSALNCAGSAVCGVAFQCEGEFCILRRRNDGQIDQGTYIVAEGPQDKAVTPLGSAVAYPIILMSELETNNEDAIKRVRMATVKIQQVAKDTTLKKLNEAKASATSLADRLNALSLAYNKMHSFRESEVAQAINRVNALRLKPQPLSAEDQALYKNLIDQLYNHNVTAGELFDFASNFASKAQPEIESLRIRTIDGINSFFVKARKSYDAKISAPLRDARTWELPVELNKVPDADLMSGQWNVAVPDTPQLAMFKRLLVSPVATASMPETNGRLNGNGLNGNGRNHLNGNQSN